MNTNTINNITIIEHTPADAFSAQIREFLTNADVPEDVSLTVNIFDGSITFEVTKWDTDRCAQCEQMLNRDELPGPATAFDQFGQFSGAYVAQHGCGAHNDPSSALVWVNEDDDMDAALAGILTELDTSVKAHLETLRAEWVERGRRALAAEQVELDAITDDEERTEFLASHEEPYGELVSVLWDGTKLYAEVYVPTLSETAEPELVYA